MASFAVGIQSGEQSIEGELPFAFRFIFVLEVVFLEFWTDVNGSLQFSANIGDILGPCTESWSDHATVDIFAGSGDDFVAGHFDQDY